MEKYFIIKSHTACHTLSQYLILRCTQLCHKPWVLETKLIGRKSNITKMFWLLQKFILLRCLCSVPVIVWVVLPLTMATPHLHERAFYWLWSDPHKRSGLIMFWFSSLNDTNAQQNCLIHNQHYSPTLWLLFYLSKVPKPWKQLKRKGKTIFYIFHDTLLLCFVWDSETLR